LFGFWAALVLAAVGLDAVAVLHAYDVVWVGLWFGPIAVSSKKSMLSASNDTERMAKAT
jgi:hypothetical protein